MKTADEFYTEWIKTASAKGLFDDWLDAQVSAHKSMRTEETPLLAEGELIKKRIYESFKLGTLAGLLAAAAGAAAGAPLGVPGIGAALGGYLGLLGGTIKGQANANKEHLKEHGFSPKGINVLRYLLPDQATTFVATSVLPESGYLKV